jgi:hypothetical protein
VNFSTTARRNIVRQASHPVRHVGNSLACGSTTGTRRQCHPCKAQVGKLNAADERYISFKYSRMVAKSCAIALPRFHRPDDERRGRH